MAHPVRVAVLLTLACALSGGARAAAAEEGKKAADARPKLARVETDLPTTRDFVPQLAFDGDAKTFFLSDRPGKAGEAFTLMLPAPAKVKQIEVSTGKPDGTDALGAGVLETSADGAKFAGAAVFKAGVAKADLGGKELRALRLRLTADGAAPLAIREITLDAEPPVPTFTYPIQIVLDASEVPDLKEWCQKVRDVAEEFYPVAAETLSYESYRPPRRIDLILKKSNKGIAGTGGSRIVCSDGWFRAHPKDVGAIIHETIHVVQSYPKYDPVWLVEGVADYVRYYVFEPDSPRRPLNRARIRYQDGYGTTAAFLDWLVRTRDKEIVRKLNKALRTSQYNEGLFKDTTGKDLNALWDEFKQSLP